MGKNLLHTNLALRNEKLAFYQVNGVSTRMEGFTDLGYSKNPKEYSRQYVDEDFERSNVVDYSPSISYALTALFHRLILRKSPKLTFRKKVCSHSKLNCSVNFYRKIIFLRLTKFR